MSADPGNGDQIAERGRGAEPENGAPPVATPHSPAFGSGLLASNPTKDKGTAVTGFLSTVLHLGIVGGVVGSTIGNTIESEVEEVTVMELTAELAAPPPPPPPPVEGPPPAEFEGFQTLTVPDIVPAEIPPPGEFVIRAEDFTGQGVEGGPGGDQDDDVVAIGEVPTFTPFTVAPVMQNGAEVARALEREYPQILKDAGVGGRVVVWIRLDEQGEVQDVQINVSSGQPSLDEAAIRVGQIIRFTAAMNRDQQVPVWVSIPIQFQVI
jgi:protein TonB